NASACFCARRSTPGGMDLRENGKLRRAIIMNMDRTAVVSGGILGRERIIAKPGFNRWLVPPAALAIHLCIGMAYGFSVFWLPLSRSIGITKFVACPDQTLLSALYTTSCDWRVVDLAPTYMLFF